jgi:protein TonB
MIAIRWLVSMLLALLITVGLFYLMQALIATGAQLESRVNVVKIVDATMPDIEMEVVREIEKPEAIEQLDTPPPDVPDRQLNMDSGPSLAIQRAAVQIDADLSIGGASISITDGEMLASGERHSDVSYSCSVTRDRRMVPGKLHRDRNWWRT